MTNPDLSNNGELLTMVIWWMNKDGTRRFSERVCKTLDSWWAEHPDVFAIIEEHAKIQERKKWPKIE